MRRINIKNLRKNVDKIEKLQRWFDYMMRYGESIVFNLGGKKIEVKTGSNMSYGAVARLDGLDQIASGNFEDVMDRLCNHYDVDRNQELRRKFGLDGNNDVKFEDDDGYIG